MGLHEDWENIKRQTEKEETEKVKIALFGQPGAGKSSIINAIVGDEVAKTGQKTDMTTTAEIYEYKSLVFVDLPGYGTSKFPPNDWFATFKPAEYDLFLCVFSGKFHEADTTFFNELRKDNRVCIFIRTKSDEIWDPGKSIDQSKSDIIKDVHTQINASSPVYFTSRRTMEGISELVDAIHNATDPAKQDRVIRSIKARTLKHLQAKRNACEKLVIKYAGLAAGNALNPIPGMDVSVDIGIVLRLFSQIRDTYGLDQSNLEYLAPVVPIANNILKFASKEGLIILLKKYATQQAIKQVAKYVPFVGQLIAASVGFAITKSAGDAYLQDCHTLAEQILKENIDLVGEAAACGGSR